MMKKVFSFIMVSTIHLKRFWVLTVKNFKLLMRNPFQTTWQILIPILFCFILLFIRSLVHTINVDSNSYEPYPIEFYSYEFTLLLYSPYSPLLEEIMKNTAKKLGLDAYPVPTSKLLVSHLRGTEGFTNIFAAVRFNDELATSTELPEKINITLSFPTVLRNNFNITDELQWHVWQTERLFPIEIYPGPRRFLEKEGGLPEYYGEGFLPLQQHLSFSLIEYYMKKKGGTFKPPVIMMRRFPFPRWVDDPFVRTMREIASLLLILGSSYSFMISVKILVKEKELKLMEIMNMLGLPKYIYIISWYFNLYICYILMELIMVWILKVSLPDGRRVLTYANSGVLVLLFLLYAFATVAFAFLLAAFFRKTSNASATAGLIWVLCCMPFLSIKGRTDTYSLPVKLICSLFLNSAFGFAMEEVIHFEGKQEGINWHNIWLNSSPNDPNFAFGYMLVMLAFDSVIYMTLSIFVERINLEKYFKNIFRIARNKIMHAEETDPRENGSDMNIEDQLDELDESDHKGIRIKKVTKEYNNKKVVNDVSMIINESEITVLLGHNGAGKTTLLSILTGIVQPTSGSIIIDNQNILKSKSRMSFGYCPQFDILIEELTVYEHLHLFCTIKGMENEEDIEREAKKYISLMNLKDKTHERASSLSGGMKRKLCAALALCADSEFVIFDEPSGAIDPKGKKSLWDVIQSQKQGRTVILTTHSMDEADIVGDKIAIMVNGKVKCMDTSFALKKKYGLGYYLILNMKSSADIELLTSALKKIIPSIYFEGLHGTEAKYRIEENLTKQIPQILKFLEDKSDSLNVANFGISFTTLGDVFTEVVMPGISKSSIKNQMEIATDIRSSNRNRINGDNEASDSLASRFSESIHSFLHLNQFSAMIHKRIFITINTIYLLIMQLTISILFTIIAVVLGRKINIIPNPKMPISLDVYTNPITLISGTNSNPYFESYHKMVNKTCIIYPEGKFYDSIMNDTIKMEELVKYYYMVGAAFETNSITAWFNNIPLHTAPLSLSMVINAILHQNVDDQHSILISNQPLEFGTVSKLITSLDKKSVGFQVAFYNGFSMAFVSAFFVIVSVYERITNFKHLQLTSGINIFIYWLSAFVWDLLLFFINFISICITLLCFQEDGYRSSTDLFHLSVVYSSFMVATLSIIYVLSFAFSSPANGFTWVTVFFLITGIVTFVIRSVLLDPFLKLVRISDRLHSLFVFLPLYSLINELTNLYLTSLINKVCRGIIQDCMKISSKSYWECYDYISKLNRKCYGLDSNVWNWKEPGVGKTIFNNFLVGFILFAMLFVIERKIFQRFRRHKHVPISTDVNEEDDDVVKERDEVGKIVENHTTINYSAVIHNMSKIYGNYVAVNKLNLVVKPAECFGLLGQNGAGKTTLFKMITGAISITEGNAWIDGLSVKRQMRKARKRMGYCPQYDAIIGELTGRQLFKIFFLLKGIPSKQISKLTLEIAEIFNFRRYLDVLIGNLSGGNKRKMSTAVAFLGHPSIVYLDEPSTGLDTISQRQIWNIIHGFRQLGTSMILTSHSMEECEALCTRVAIMTFGKFKCIGSIQHLKQKFMGGYILSIKFMLYGKSYKERTDPIKKFIKDLCPDSVLKEEYTGFLRYHIQSFAIPLSKIFQQLEEGKNKVNIDDYALGQAGLEQVFLTFVEDSTADDE